MSFNIFYSTTHLVKNPAPLNVIVLKLRAIVEYKCTQVSTEIICRPAASAILIEQSPKYRPIPQWALGNGQSVSLIKYNLCSKW